MNETIFCEKCGTAMIPIDSNRPVGMTCPNCGWGWATSYIDPIFEDTTKYSVSLIDGNEGTKEAIRTIAEIAGMNYLQAKRALQDGTGEIISGSAVQIRDIIKDLIKVGIRHQVEPTFPYSLSSEEAGTDEESEASYEKH